MTQPSPAEARQAAQLAQALERGVDGAWEAIGPDVSEAVFALRPELAPPPRADLLTEVLDELTEGPLAQAPSEEELAEAEAFAEALDSGQPPALTDELSEAVIALAPSRAPAPSLTIDDILDSVATGPFAPVIRITGEFPAVIAPPTDLTAAPAAQTTSQDTPKLISLTERRRASQSPPTRRWWFPAVGVLAAAAGVLLFVGPTQLTQLDSEMPIRPAAMVADEAAPALAAEEAEEELASPASDIPEPDTDDAPAPRRRAAPTTKSAARSASKPSALGSPSTASAAPSPEPSPEPDLGPAPAAAVTEAPQDSDLEYDLESAVRAASDAAPSVSGDYFTNDEASPSELPAKKIETFKPRPARRSTRNTSSPKGGSSGSPPPSLGLLEPSLAEERPDLHEIWAQAERYSKQGNHIGSARLLTSLASRELNPNVVVDAAVRAGQAWLVVGDLQAARASLALADLQSPSYSRLLSAREALRQQLAAQSADRPSSGPG